MKKIIVLFNGINAPWHITTFALNIAKQNNAEVQAIFLKDEENSYPFPSDITSVQNDLSPAKEKADDEILEEKNVQLFKTFCEDEKVKCSFELNVSLKKLVDLSTGADCIVADSRDDFRKYSLKDIMAEVKSPLCLISVNATKIKNAILLYDGSDDAMLAIKTYSNLFPKLNKKKTFLVTINEKEKIKRKHREAIFQKLEKRFDDLETVSLTGKLEKKLIEFLDDHTENTMVVMGAYGRSSISLLFKPSLANVVLNQSRTSLFIAHD
ncbi:universal stress protein [Ginsengibacter hankyongi]|uniref:Universal stress protein n=1 Tax=Ginsengibacter hankyongi TaxID=2607284 RepID=A0A5J5INU8_9BACT|nr:universal stress protein [Ginsengibacter hankyongi]KAA9041172.1 universal stress protein [Ginsengibacter hankyongi]